MYTTQFIVKFFERLSTVLIAFTQSPQVNILVYLCSWLHHDLRNFFLFVLGMERSVGGLLFGQLWQKHFWWFPTSEKSFYSQIDDSFVMLYLLINIY